MMYMNNKKDTPSHARAKLAELVRRTDRIAERCGISFEEALCLLLAQALKIKIERNKAELHTDN